MKYLVGHTNAPPDSPLPEERKVFADSGLEIELISRVCTTEEDVLEVGREAHALLVPHAPITRRVLENMPKCRVVVRYGHGFDVVDVAAATEHGIVVANVPFVAEEVAEHTIMLIFVCERKVVRLDRAIRAGEWQRAREQLSPMACLEGKTLGLVAFGRIAQAVTWRAQALGLECLAADPYVSPDIIKEHGAEPVELEELLSRSDFVSLHSPLNSETRHLIGERELRRMKPTAYLINTSRGAVVDEKALIRALKEGWIAGAGLDVFEVEPLPGDSPLIELDNVILTPHSAGYSDAGRPRGRAWAAQEVVRVLKGYWPKNLVNPEVKEKIKLREC